MLYKGHLLVQHQIEATSKKRDKVAEVEHAFEHWTKQIKTVVAQGYQLPKEHADSGPLRELEHWRKLLAKFNLVCEFINTQAFQNYKLCLKLSRCKLIRVS
jgi:dynein heavy chain